MLIQYLREEFPDFRETNGGNITDLTVFYKNAKVSADAWCRMPYNIFGLIVVSSHSHTALSSLLYVNIELAYFNPESV